MNDNTDTLAAANEASTLAFHSWSSCRPTMTNLEIQPWKSSHTLTQGEGQNSNWHWPQSIPALQPFPEQSHKRRPTHNRIINSQLELVEQVWILQLNPFHKTKSICAPQENVYSQASSPLSCHLCHLPVPHEELRTSESNSPNICRSNPVDAVQLWLICKPTWPHGLCIFKVCNRLSVHQAAYCVVASYLAVLLCPWMLFCKKALTIHSFLSYSCGLASQNHRHVSCTLIGHHSTDLQRQMIRAPTQHSQERQSHQGCFLGRANKGYFCEAFI